MRYTKPFICLIVFQLSSFFYLFIFPFKKKNNPRGRCSRPALRAHCPRQCSSMYRAEETNQPIALYLIFCSVIDSAKYKRCLQLAIFFNRKLQNILIVPKQVILPPLKYPIVNLMVPLRYLLMDNFYKKKVYFYRKHKKL